MLLYNEDILECLDQAHQIIENGTNPFYNNYQALDMSPYLASQCIIEDERYPTTPYYVTFFSKKSNLDKLKLK